MNQYVAFLRAINVAGHAKVKMSDLKQAFAEAGCRNVRTYIQSGNVLFEIPAGTEESSKQKIQNRLDDLLGAEAVVMYRTAREMKGAINNAPFADFQNQPDTKLYVAFLSRKPSRKPAFPLLSPKEALQAVNMKNLNVYIVSRKKKNGGYGFPNNFIEKQLGVPATTRNWSTLSRIAGLLSGTNG